MGDILKIGVSGLQAAQRALSTTGNNITNVNTPGYSRQRVDFAPRQDQILGGLAIGKGVNIERVSRVVNEFLNTNVQTSATNVGTMASYNTYSTQVDKLLADNVIGLSPSMQDFFDFVNALADDPSSIPTRQTMLGSAESLAAKFHSLDRQLDQLDAGVNQELRSNVTQINSLTAQIADINGKLTLVNGRGDAGSNSLNDQLGQAVNELSKLIGVTTNKQASGGLNIMTSGGQVLVSGGSNYELGTQLDPMNPSQLEVTYQVGSNNIAIAANTLTGEIGGLLKVREEVLDKARNSLGRLAAGVALEFNSLQAGGRDLDGVLGGDLFSIPSLSAFGEGTVTGAMTVAFDVTKVDEFTTSDYRISFDGAAYTVTRLSDNTQTNLGAGPALTIDGLNITITTPAAANDSFIIQPMKDLAGEIKVAISDPKKIAAAADPFAGVGDNTNALKMADLQLDNILEGGKASFNDAYSQLIGDVGTKARQAKTGLEAMEAVEQSAIEARDSVSGVNLDEEAADLLKFQQAYQAAARVIAIGNELFGTLLQAVR